MIERKWGRSILKVLLPSIRIFQSIAIVWISEAREQEREFCEQPLLKLWSLELLLLQTLNGKQFPIFRRVSSTSSRDRFVVSCAAAADHTEHADLKLIAFLIILYKLIMMIKVMVWMIYLRY